MGSCEKGYNKIVDNFCTNRVGAFDRIVMVNPLYQSLPRLVLMVMCTCNCFDAPWVRQQWLRIQDLWNKECKNILGPIVEHTSDVDESS